MLVIASAAYVKLQRNLSDGWEDVFQFNSLPPRLPVTYRLPKSTVEQAGQIRRFHNLASQIDGSGTTWEPGEVPRTDRKFPPCLYCRGTLRGGLGEGGGRDPESRVPALSNHSTVTWRFRTLWAWVRDFFPWRAGVFKFVVTWRDGRGRFLFAPQDDQSDEISP